jgi:hypothetical protein
MPVSQPTIEKLWASFLALLPGYYLVVEPARQVWKDCWLVKDAQQTVAVITKEHWAGHDVVVYRYSVNGQEYTGQDRRSYEGAKYTHVMPGEKAIIYFSSSHPWLSAINRPRIVMVEGLPVILIGWAIEVLLIGTVINPRCRWALNFSGQSKTQSGIGKLE